ncbi:MAG: hypothetical protein WCJ62_12260 [Flavobacterium sp.]
MENTTVLPSALLNEKSMYIKINLEKVEKIGKMIELLNKRKEIINNEQVGLPDFESNERQILLLKTDYELAKHHKNCIDIKKEIDGYIEKATDVITEMDTRWGEIIAKAKKEGVHKKDIRDILKSMDDVDIEDNIDVKINYYLHLKSMVLNQKTPEFKKV